MATLQIVHIDNHRFLEIFSRELGLALSTVVFKSKENAMLKSVFFDIINMICKSHFADSLVTPFVTINSQAKS